ncbi:MAG: ABC transporter ATP-binding protein [Myxococcota bacterium]
MSEPRYRLDVRDLSFSASGNTLLSDVQLSLRGGELVAVLGPSGSGKSTLLSAMIGFRRGKGQVRLSGRDLYAEFDALKTRIGFVPQDDVVPGALTVEAALGYAARLRLPAAMPEPLRRAEVRRVMAEVELADRAKVRVRRLSGGQRKRVSLAIELLAAPPLLFLDEPTSGLDPDLEDKSMQLFRRLTTEGRITVVTTHVLASLELVDLALFMAQGRMVYLGPPQEAPAFFGVSDLPSVYRTLAKGPAAPWAAKLRASTYYQTLVTQRLAEPVTALPSPERRGDVLAAS